MRVGERTDFDRLFLEIETDGTIVPEEAFDKSCKILIKHFTLISEGKAGQAELDTEKNDKSPKKLKAKKEIKKVAKPKKK